MSHGAQVDVYLQHSCVLEQFGANAVDLVCDSRSVLIGFSDGTFQLLSWQSQVRTCRSFLHAFQPLNILCPHKGFRTLRILRLPEPLSLMGA